MDDDRWFPWFKALVAAVVSGAAHGAAAILSAIILAPDNFNFGPGLVAALKLAAVSALVGGLISGSAYLQKSPLPDEGSK